ncbi:MAG: hypothetical protein P8012_17515 [Desulfobacterales bacterium]
MKKITILPLLIIILSFSHGIAGSHSSPEDSGHKTVKKTSKTLNENKAIFQAAYFRKKAIEYENSDEWKYPV